MSRVGLRGPLGSPSCPRTVSPRGRAAKATGVTGVWETSLGIPESRGQVWGQCPYLSALGFPKWTNTPYFKGSLWWPRSPSEG